MSGYDLSDCPDLTQFAADHRPGHHTDLRHELLELVREGVDAHPRSAQTEIGPSEIGHPCNRWLAYRFAGTPEIGIQKPKWRAAVGTAVHDHFADWLHRWNEHHGTRWLSETRVWVGDLYPGRPITGHMDCFDTWTATVVDLKVPGPTSLKNAKAAVDNGPQYDVQLDLYGQGAINAGLTVNQVGILRLPAAGELADADWKLRPHNPQRAKQALARAGAIAQLVDTLGAAAIPLQTSTEHYCHTCPWFSPNSSDLQTGCPGAATFIEKRDNRVDPLYELASTATS